MAADITLIIITFPPTFQTMPMCLRTLQSPSSRVTLLAAVNIDCCERSVTKLLCRGGPARNCRVPSQNVFRVFFFILFFCIFSFRSGHTSCATCSWVHGALDSPVDVTSVVSAVVDQSWSAVAATYVRKLAPSERKVARILRDLILLGTISGTTCT